MQIKQIVLHENVYHEKICMKIKHGGTSAWLNPNAYFEKQSNSLIVQYPS